jgi:hypothetical protein
MLEELQKQKAKTSRIGHKPAVTHRVGAATLNVGSIQDMFFPVAASVY